MEGSIEYDAGAYIHDGIKSIKKLGVCPETEWPYIEDKFTVEPSADCYIHALKH